MKWDPNRYIDHGFMPCCRFDDNCDLILLEDGCSTCDFANGLISDELVEVALPHSRVNSNEPIPG